MSLAGRSTNLSISYLLILYYLLLSMCPILNFIGHNFLKDSFLFYMKKNSRMSLMAYSSNQLSVQISITLIRLWLNSKLSLVWCATPNWYFLNTRESQSDIPSPHTQPHHRFTPVVEHCRRSKMLV